MCPWPESLKASLRHLAAARYFLPKELDFGEFSDSERQFCDFLHHRELGLALEELEGLGETNRGHAEESLFWMELMLAAESMDLPEHADRYRIRMRECE